MHGSTHVGTTRCCIEYAPKRQPIDHIVAHYRFIYVCFASDAKLVTSTPYRLILAVCLHSSLFQLPPTPNKTTHHELATFVAGVASADAKYTCTCFRQHMKVSSCCHYLDFPTNSGELGGASQLFTKSVGNINNSRLWTNGTRWKGSFSWFHCRKVGYLTSMVNLCAVPKK